MTVKQDKIYVFSRAKKDCSVLKTHYSKFLNFLMRKGYRNRFITLFYKLLRLFKKRMMTIYHWRKKKFKIKFPSRTEVLSFPKFFKSVFDKITLELELKSRKFRKKEILIPIPVSPWKGTRMGLSLLLKNSQTRIDKKKKHRKHKFLYNLLDEMWDTQNQTSLTSKNVVEFTENVLEHAENFRSTRLFPVKKSRRMVYPSKLLETLEDSKNEKLQIKGKKRLSSAEYFKEQKRKKDEFIKKVLVKMKKFKNKGSLGFIKKKGEFRRINLIKLAQAKLLLENAKKQIKLSKKKHPNKYTQKHTNKHTQKYTNKYINKYTNNYTNKHTNKYKKKRNSLDSFLYSIFMKAKKKKKLKIFSFKQVLFTTLKKKKN